LKEALAAYQLNDPSLSIEPFGTGLINRTWKLIDGGKSFVLQKINQAVFNDPAKIDKNIRIISTACKANHPEQLFVSPLPNNNGETLTYLPGDGYYRLFPFVNGSHSIDAVDNEQQAYEAAAQFAKFTAALKEVDLSQLELTIPDFHNLEIRYAQFVDAMSTGNTARVIECQKIISRLLELNDIVAEYSRMLHTRPFLKRVAHHDTKISNVLFDENDKGICVVDLDTVMPGYFISDIGDMMRTYLSPVTEEEQDLSKVFVRPGIYKAIVDGYLSGMGPQLNEAEKYSFFYAAKFMIYMQALRFLTDYLRDDIYYGAKYTTQNLSRAQNQLALLEDLISREATLKAYPFQ
jgi:Ser/Thr protein kinase RdoA (MazF antagonist)